MAIKKRILAKDQPDAAVTAGEDAQGVATATDTPDPASEPTPDPAALLGAVPPPLEWWQQPGGAPPPK